MSKLVIRDELGTSLYAKQGDTQSRGLLHISTTDDIYVPSIGLNKGQAIELRNFLNEFIEDNNEK